MKEYPNHNRSIVVSFNDKQRWIDLASKLNVSQYQLTTMLLDVGEKTFIKAEE